MTMEIESRPAREIIGKERLAWLRRCVEDAWAVFDEKIRRFLPTCEPLALPSLIRQLILQEIKKSCEAYEGVSVIPSHKSGRFLVVIDGQVVIQIKKLTEDLQTVNIETKTSRKFDLQLPLPGYPDNPRLTLGYKLDDFGTQLLEVLLIFSIGNDCQWHYNLQTGERSQEITFPIRPVSDAADQAGSRHGERGTSK